MGFSLSKIIYPSSTETPSDVPARQTTTTRGAHVGSIALSSLLWSMQIQLSLHVMVMMMNMMKTSQVVYTDIDQVNMLKLMFITANTASKTDINILNNFVLNSC